jgi:uncharacterized protein YecE (DUF72 family)
MTIETNRLVRIGTSGIVLPGNKSTFPVQFQAKTRLHYYSTFFNTLEINSSFYKIPKFSTFEKWSNEVPEDFKFTVKLWRGITHAKKLEYSGDDVAKFMLSAEGLGDKKGCLLIQFPTSIGSDYFSKVEKLFQDIVEFNQQEKWQFAVEFRHNSWYHEDLYKNLAQHNTSLVLHDMPNSATPINYLASKNTYSGCLYLRFHGPTGNYDGSYSNHFIDGYAERIKDWTCAGKTVYIYFNNTIGSALLNAQRLQNTLIGSQLSSSNSHYCDDKSAF